MKKLLSILADTGFEIGKLVGKLGQGGELGKLGQAEN
jgi:hypothetical protein